MWYFCTAGRGTEKFVAEECTQFLGSTENRQLDGKVILKTDSPVSAVLSLRTAERVFALLYHNEDTNLHPGQRGLNELCRVVRGVNPTAWKDALHTWQQVVHCGTENRRNTGPSPTEPPETSNSCEAEDAAPAKKRRTEVKDHEEEETDEPFAKVTFRVSCKCSGRVARLFHPQELSRALGCTVAKINGWTPDLRSPQVEIFVQLNNDGMLMGLTLTQKPLSKRGYLQTTGLRTPVAWIMASLASIEVGSVVLDPMCGVATILIEACTSWPDAMYVGVDCDPKQMAMAANNLQHSEQGSKVVLFRGDAAGLPMMEGSVDVIVCDLPFGQNHSDQLHVKPLYQRVLPEMDRVLKFGGKIVLLTSASLKDYLCHLVNHSGTIRHQSRAHPPLCDTNARTAENCSEIQNADIASVIPFDQTSDVNPQLPSEPLWDMSAGSIQSPAISDNKNRSVNNPEAVMPSRPAAESSRVSEKDQTTDKSLCSSGCSPGGSVDQASSPLDLCDSPKLPAPQVHGAGDPDTHSSGELGKQGSETTLTGSPAVSSTADAESARQTDGGHGVNKSIQWTAQAQHYVKLGETHAYICVFQKTVTKPE